MNNVYCAPNDKLMLSKDIAIEYLKTESKDPDDLLRMQRFQPPPGKRAHPQSKRSKAVTVTPDQKDTNTIDQEPTFDFVPEQHLKAEVNAEQFTHETSHEGEELDSSDQTERSFNEDQTKGWKCNNELYPSGWMFGGRSRNPNAVKLRAPEGTILVGVKSALHYMTSNNYPEDDIAMMRRALSQNGWEEHDTLPENWFYRRKGRAIEFCDPEGRSYNSKEKVLKTNMLLKESDLVKLRKFQAPKNSTTDDEYVGDISILPPGWKILKDYDAQNRNARIISPQGLNFRTKRSALAYMMESNFSNDDIEKLHKSIEQDGWFTHQNLPMNWRYKKRSISGLLFSDPSGFYFKSREKALKSLRKFPEENMNDISLLSKFQL